MFVEEFFLLSWRLLLSLKVLCKGFEKTSTTFFDPKSFLCYEKPWSGSGSGFSNSLDPNPDSVICIRNTGCQYLSLTKNNP
jgi:hypothetical protein